mmetsp:Transcript_24286/g.86737  ORF Transcript_24286/g.86737 Transcript_24286/m.86737 type:complete len:434 (+) Transcript_24286:161-1462(+)
MGSAARRDVRTLALCLRERAAATPGSERLRETAVSRRSRSETVAPASRTSLLAACVTIESLWAWAPWPDAGEGAIMAVMKPIDAFAESSSSTALRGPRACAEKPPSTWPTAPPRWCAPPASGVCGAASTRASKTASATYASHKRCKCCPATLRQSSRPTPPPVSPSPGTRSSYATCGVRSTRAGSLLNANRRFCRTASAVSCAVSGPLSAAGGNDRGCAGGSDRDAAGAAALAASSAEASSLGVSPSSPGDVDLRDSSPPASSDAARRRRTHSAPSGVVSARSLRRRRSASDFSRSENSKCLAAPSPTASAPPSKSCTLRSSCSAATETAAPPRTAAPEGNSESSAGGAGYQSSRAPLGPGARTNHRRRHGSRRAASSSVAVAVDAFACFRAKRWCVSPTAVAGESGGAAEEEASSRTSARACGSPQASWPRA